MKETTFPIPKLPDDVIVEILTWLPVKPLLKFKCVCKSWRALISSHQFVRAHLKSHPNLTYNLLSLVDPGNLKKCSVNSLLYDSVSEASDLSFPFQPKIYLWPVTSCNGLILVYMDGKELFLWNPSIRACKNLAGLCVENDKPYGLGYDKSSDDYKVVLFSCNGTDTCEVMVQVYSLRNDQLKRITDLDGRRLKKTIGKYTNGKLYWIAYRDYEYETGWDILSLDMEKEEVEFEIQQLPNYVKIGHDSRLQVCEGSLYLICTHKTCADVWLMDGCSGNVGVEKWTKVVTVPCINHRWEYTRIWLLHVEKNGLVLLIYGKTFVVYDVKDRSFRYREVRNLSDFAGRQTYVESLVSPVG